jgi:hypothetical protein
MTDSSDIRRVRRELLQQRLDAFATDFCWFLMGLALLGLLTILGQAALAGRLTP